jgi:formate dehydrogenase major subunit
MTGVNITVDGQKIRARAGQTVYQAAAEAGIDIPVLCHHPALPPEGACRVCLVEIERQRNLQPSCTFPVTEGMVVYTESERVVAARRFALELLFSERIHYCMVCPLSGDECGSQCELQRLAYRYGLTSWRFPPDYARSWGVDASGKHVVMDHSRCILCRRCVRACDLIVVNHTLGVRERGSRAMVIADDDVPFGESTCVSCGTCLQVCPTGALIDRRSAYMGAASDLARARTTCMGCPVGCGIEAVTRGDRLVRVDGDWQAANGGLLCMHGRFGVVEPQPERVTAPLVRRGGVWGEATWEEALDIAARGLRAAGAVAGLASPRATNEEFSAFRSLFDGIMARKQPSESSLPWPAGRSQGGQAVFPEGANDPRNQQVIASGSVQDARLEQTSSEAISGLERASRLGLLYGEVPPAVGPSASIADLEAADLIVVVGGQPLEDQKVVGYLVRRTVEAGAKPVTVNVDGESWHPEAGNWNIDAAERPVVLYATGLPAAAYDDLRALPGKTRFMPLYTGANAAGAAWHGLTARAVAGDALFVYAADEAPDGDGTGDESPYHVPEARFVVVQAAYGAGWTARADVILPAQTWLEKTGHIVNIEGRDLPVSAVVRPPDGRPSDVETLENLRRLL